MNYFITYDDDNGNKKLIEIPSKFKSKIGEILKDLVEEKIFSLRKITEIFERKITFNIPSIQRGYRWKANEQVRLLLEDIRGIKEDVYCLQPIVVSKKEENSYNLIDGQQRFTTLYLVFKALKQHNIPNITQCNISISYETRKTDKVINFTNNSKVQNISENFEVYATFYI